MSTWVAVLIVAALGALVWVAIYWDETEDKDQDIKQLAKEQKQRFPSVSKPDVLEKLKRKSEEISRRG